MLVVRVAVAGRVPRLELGGGREVLFHMNNLIIDNYHTLDS
jgi:hypothetical protein